MASYLAITCPENFDSFIFIFLTQRLLHHVARDRTEANYATGNRFTPHTSSHGAKRRVGVQEVVRRLIDHSRVLPHHSGINSVVRQPF